MRRKVWTTQWVHARCGGRLSAEQHQKWVTAYAGGRMSAEPVLSKQTEILYRCDRCNLVGVDAGPAREGVRPPR